MTRRHVIKTLVRRQNYLTARVATAARNQELDFDKRELSAISFVLGVMEDAEAIGLERLGRLTLEEREQLRRLLEGASEAA